jgi:hypothetical protein
MPLGDATLSGHFHSKPCREYRELSLLLCGTSPDTKLDNTAARSILSSWLHATRSLHIRQSMAICVCSIFELAHSYDQSNCGRLKLESLFGWQQCLEPPASSSLMNPNIEMSKLSSMHMYITPSPSLPYSFGYQIHDTHPRYNNPQDIQSLLFGKPPA